MTEGGESRLKIEKIGKMNKEQTALFKLLNNMTSDKENGISVRLTNNDQNVKFDNYESRSFDPSDVNSLPTSGNTRTQAGFYAHFFAEQWDSQVTQGITGTIITDDDEIMPIGYFQAHVEALYQEYLELV